MADNRKYYYLKLKEDFFDTDEMKILESMKDGYLYSNILLKLYLKSLSNSGRLMYRNVIPYTPEILAKVKKSKYTLDQVIILASMVESEAATTEDRKTVAGVFLNRLHHPDKFPKLESCVTVEYAKGIKKDIISLADTKYNSKYNTYKYPVFPTARFAARAWSPSMRCCPPLTTAIITSSPIPRAGCTSPGPGRNMPKSRRSCNPTGRPRKPGR